MIIIPNPAVKLKNESEKNIVFWKNLNFDRNIVRRAKGIIKTNLMSQKYNFISGIR